MVIFYFFWKHSICSIHIMNNFYVILRMAESKGERGTQMTAVRRRQFPPFCFSNAGYFLSVGGAIVTESHHEAFFVHIQFRNLFLNVFTPFKVKKAQ